jgi:hypothetical protein
MKVKDIRQIAERRPFQPFVIRLTNGSEYETKQPRDLGATKDYRSIFYFGESSWDLIATESIVAASVR